MSDCEPRANSVIETESRLTSMVLTAWLLE